MSLTKSPLGVFLISAITLGGVLDVLLSANGVSSFLSGDVRACGRESKHCKGIGHVRLHCLS